jgi:hypothetical protein
MILLGDTSELSFEPAIEGRFDRSSCDVPSRVTKNVLAPILPVTVLSAEAQTVQGRRPNGPRLGTEARVFIDELDGPRLMAGWSARAQR